MIFSLNWRHDVFHYLVLILMAYLCCMFLLWVTDGSIGEKKKYKGRPGLKRLLLHGLYALPVAVLVLLFVPYCPIC